MVFECTRVCNLKNDTAHLHCAHVCVGGCVCLRFCDISIAVFSAYRTSNETDSHGELMVSCVDIKCSESWNDLHNFH